MSYNKLTFLSLMSGCGGMDLGLEKAGFKCVGQIEKMKYALKILKKHWPKIPKHTDILTFCVRGGHVKAIRSRVADRVKRIRKAGSGGKWQDVCDYLSHNGFLERMFPGFYPLMTKETLLKLRPSLIKSGMAYRGQYLIVNTLELPRDAVDSSLSDTLEESVPQRFYLSKKAVQGIIRRATKWRLRGYVLLQETDKDMTQSEKRLLPPQSDAKITTKQHRQGKTLSEQSAQMMDDQTTLPLKRILLKPSMLIDGELELFGQKLLLRKLTPTEKEKLQGFPKDWTLVEE